MNYKDLLYGLTCLSFTNIIGAAAYEHLAVVPQWSAGPPVSLSMFQGEFGLRADRYWKMIHPLTLILFIITLTVFRKSSRRKDLLIVFVSYLAILAVTALYFVPELLSIIATEYSGFVDPSLTDRAALWELLSIIRMALLIILNFVLFHAMAKPTDEIRHSKAA